ncbi:hypothetical protein NDU88_003246 [Pleurodeles waltl]|uniref:Uncharacterized protein n=1 Tax=Pleurodeles waltl TaxID=8319 RepID=A0AAV7WR49_PLEWA|nr:hypothetical protein NDU88_003246 [Pleurodeles waltl]
MDVPTSQNGIKKSKKQPKNPVSPPISKGTNTLDETDLLFEEVDEILNYNSQTPIKKSETLGVGKIPEIFAKKKKSLVTYSPPLNPSSEVLPPPRGKSTHKTAAISCSFADALPSHPGLPLTGTMANPPPLSPEIVVIPNIPCTNRFGLLVEEGGSPACVPHDQHGAAIESNAQRDSDPTPDDVQIRWANGNLDLVLQKVDEVKTLAMSLMGLLKETLVPKCACSCQTTIKKAGTDTGPISMTKLGLQSVVPPSKVAMNLLPLESPLTLAKCNQQDAVRLCQKYTGALNTRVARGGAFTATCSRPLEARPEGVVPSRGSGGAAGFHGTSTGVDMSLVDTSQQARQARHLAQLSKDCTIYMINVPKLTHGSYEDHESLTNKGIHWFRFRRHCLSVIRSDILEVGRHDLPGLNYDYIIIEPRRQP